jgi:Carboxypeptidase regulatory-like domain
MKDTSGAVVPGIIVTLTNELTNTEQKVTINESGEFSATFLPVRRYTISVSAQGLKTLVQRGLELIADSKSAIPSRLPARIETCVMHGSKTVDERLHLPLCLGCRRIGCCRFVKENLRASLLSFQSFAR